MKQLILISLIGVLSFLAKPVLADETCSIVYGSDWAFLMVAPDKWKTACHVEETHGVSVALWQSDSEWGKTTPFMYITLSSKNDTSIEQFVDYEVSKFKSNSDTINVSESPSITTADSGTALVRRFTDSTNGFVEFVAYVDIGTQYIIIVLHAKSETDLNSVSPAFNSLVQSIRKMNIKFEKVKRKGDKFIFT